MNTDISTFGMVEWLVVTGGILLIGFIGYQVHWYMNYKWEYSKMMEDNGIVVDMDYTPSRTTYHSGGKNSSGYTTTTQEEHDVYIEAKKLGRIHRDNEHLYQRVRIDDEVLIRYKERYRVRKDNPRDRQFDSNRLQELVNPKGRVIQL